MQGSTNLLNLPKLDPTNDQVATGATADQTGACTPYSYTSVSTGFDATVMKASAGRLYFIYGMNADPSKLAVFKLYDKATAPDPSADSALLKWQVFFPPTETLETDTEPQWNPIIIPIPHGIGFATGIAFVITQGLAADETAVDANDVFIQVAYK